MTIDLRKNAKDVRAMLTEGVSRYVAQSAAPTSASDYPPVSAISLVYDCGFGAHVTLNFDTRPAYEPDGTWTHDAVAEMVRPEWEKSYTALQERDLQFTLTDGSPHTLPAATDDETYAAVFGQMLVEVLKSARAAEEFAPLPKTPDCEMGVEEVEGMFGWPDFDDRGQDNSAHQGAA